MDPSLTYNAFGHTYDDKDLKDSKLRKTKSTVRLRKRKTAPPKRSKTVLADKGAKLPLIVQLQTVEERAITPQEPSPSSVQIKTSGETTNSDARRNTIDSGETILVLPDIHKPRAESAAAEASTSREPTEQQSAVAEAEAEVATEAEEEAPQKATVTEVTPAPAEPPAPKKEEGFKLNFKFDFTKVNFKKKAQEKEKKKKEEEQAKLLQTVKEAQTATKAAEKLVGIRDANKAAANKDGEEGETAHGVPVEEDDEYEEWSSDFSEEDDEDDQEKEADNEEDDEDDQEKEADNEEDDEDDQEKEADNEEDDQEKEADNDEANESKTLDKEEAIEDEHASVVIEAVVKESPIKAAEEVAAAPEAIAEEEDEDSGYSDSFDSYESDFESESDDE